MQRNGDHVTSLYFEGFDGALTELPCQHLQQLVLVYDKVQLGPGRNQPGVLHGCSDLTALQLRSCTMRGGRCSLSALSAVPALQHLELSNLYTVGNQQKLVLPGSTLQVLTQLTSLCVETRGMVTAELLQHISALQHLQSLHLSSPTVPLSPNRTPGLVQLTGLQMLSLASATLDPAMLQQHTQLQHVSLYEATLPGPDGGCALLAAFSHYLHLQQLHLLDVQCVWPTAAAAFMALTASSRLERLAVELNGVPAGIWQAVFRPQQQQLPHLHTFFARSGAYQEAGVAARRQGAAAMSFSHADVSRLVGCCPGLERLDLHLQPDVQLSALSQLTALTALDISKATESSVRSIAQLLPLRSLGICFKLPFSVTTLLRLTALQQLTCLSVSVDVDEEDDDELISGAIDLYLSTPVSDFAARSA